MYDQGVYDQGVRDLDPIKGSEILIYGDLDLRHGSEIMIRNSFMCSERQGAVLPALRERDEYGLPATGCGEAILVHCTDDHHGVMRNTLAMRGPPFTYPTATVLPSLDMESPSERTAVP